MTGQQTKGTLEITMLVNIASLQTMIPNSVKFALKPYYRRIFPNRLHVLMHPTFRCNYRCSYCLVVTNFNFLNVFPKSGERSAAEWCEALSKLPPAMIYIQGGEPFVYAELPELLNNLPRQHAMLGIVTNLSMPTAIYRKIKRPLHLNVSLHREFVEESAFIAKIKELSATGQFHIAVNIVATLENLPVLERLAAECSREKVSLHVDPLVDPGFRYSSDQRQLLDRFIQADRIPDEQLDFGDFGAKSCSAGRNYFALAPNGDAYTCSGGMSYVHSPIYRPLTEGREIPEFSMGNIFDSKFRLSQADTTCALPCKEACDRDSVRIKRTNYA